MLHNIIHGLVSLQHGEERAPPADVLRYLLLLTIIRMNKSYLSRFVSMYDCSTVQYSQTVGWPCVAGPEVDGSPGGGGPGTALCSPAEGAAGGPGHSGLPPGHCGSSAWPLPHQGGLQPSR